MRTATVVILGALFGCGSADSRPKPQIAKLEMVPAKRAGKAEQATDTGKQGPPAPSGPIIDHKVKDIDGNDVALSDYRGKTMLIVNTASECGSTPQYAGLQELHAKYADKGLVVLGFPSNDFGEQEPGDHEHIKAFVAKEYGVEFPMFAKVATKGDSQAPLYKTLTKETPAGIKGEIEWNFTKFLVDPQGEVVARFATKVEPTAKEVVSAIEKHLPRG